MMKKWIKIFLIIEIQVVILLFFVIIIKINSLDNKVFNTNKFVYEALIDKKIESLNVVRDFDIIIGNDNAPVTIFLYSRFDCPACNEFIIDNFEPLKTDFIDKDLVKLVVRYLVHPSKQNTLYATKCAYYSNQLGYYESFIRKISNSYPALDTVTVKFFVLDLAENTENLNRYLGDETIDEKLFKLASEIRSTGLNFTPTIYINNQRLIGNRRYVKLKETILSELENEYCE